MAIWQCSMFLKSRKKILLSDIKFLNSIESLNKTFAYEKSWSDSIRQYGKLDETCFEIYESKRNFVEEISLRIDLRNVTKQELQCICDFCETNNLYISFQRKRYQASIENLVTILKKSPAYRFLSDPEEYLKSISQSGNGSKLLKKRDF